MDGGRFDALTRSMTLTRPRRSVLRALAGGALGALLAPLAPASAADECGRDGDRCRRSGQCCGRLRCAGGKCCHPTVSSSRAPRRISAVLRTTSVVPARTRLRRSAARRSRSAATAAADGTSAASTGYANASSATRSTVRPGAAGSTASGGGSGGRGGERVTGRRRARPDRRVPCVDPLGLGHDVGHHRA